MITCNDCKYYDPWDGVCSLNNDNHYGYEDACEKFKQENDTKNEGEKNVKQRR